MDVLQYYSEHQKKCSELWRLLIQMNNTKINIRKVGDFIEKIAPLNSGVTHDELGYIYGNPDAEVRGIAVMWLADSSSIQKAIDLGCNLLIVHETLFYAPQQSDWYDGPQADEGIVANTNRKKLLTKNNLVVYRAHSNWDALDTYGVPDSAVADLKLGKLSVVAEQKFFKVHKLPTSLRVSQLATIAKKGLGLSWEPRVFGDRDKRIETFSFLIGGFGGNQYNMPQVAAESGAQCVIVGEMLESIAINALENNIPVIETLHSKSEEPGLRNQHSLLKEHFSNTPVHFIPSGATNFVIK